MYRNQEKNKRVSRKKGRNLENGRVKIKWRKERRENTRTQCRANTRKQRKCKKERTNRRGRGEQKSFVGEHRNVWPLLWRCNFFSVFHSLVYARILVQNLRIKVDDYKVIKSSKKVNFSVFAQTRLSAHDRLSVATCASEVREIFLGLTHEQPFCGSLTRHFGWLLRETYLFYEVCV